MAKLKKGASIGKTDSAYHSLKVGDTIRNIHSGLLATITNYGVPRLCIGGTKVNPFKSNEWILDTPWDANLKTEYEAKQKTAEQEPAKTDPEFEKFCEEFGLERVEESPAAEPAETIVEVREEPETINAASNIEDESSDDEAEVLLVPASQEESDMHKKAQEAVDLLRSLGYAVTATKTVSCTISL